MQNLLIKTIISFFLLAGNIYALDHDLFEKEISLSHKLLRREIKDKKKYFYYRLNLKNLKNIKRKDYNLFMMNPFGAPKKTEIELDENGKAWIIDAEGKKILNEFEMILTNFMDGEAFDFILMDERKVPLAATHVVPKPIQCSLLNGAQIYLELFCKNGYTLVGEGFKPNEKLLFTSQSEDEIIPNATFQADSYGKIWCTLCPAVKGKKIGRAKIKIIREDSTRMELAYIWEMPEEKLINKF